MHRDEPEAGAEVPAAGPLAEVAADRPHRQHLPAADSGDGLGDRREGLADRAVLTERPQPGGGADVEPAVGLVGPGEILDRLQVDEARRRRRPVLHQAQEIRAAGERHGALGGQHPDRVVGSPGTRVFEGAHQAIPPPLIAASTRSGVIGISLIGTPAALLAALAIAAPGAMTGGSPRPITPRSS